MEDLHILVAEYISEKGLIATKQKFEEECKAKGISLEPLKNSSVGSKFKFEELIVAFECGEHDVFFQLWSQLIPAYVLLNDPTCQDLELSLAVYFAIYPSKGKLSANDNVHMARFRDYLDRRGAALSKLPSFTLFCALPYVPDPVSHPSYKHLFTESWKKELQNRVEKFVLTFTWLPSQFQEVVKLEDLYHSFLTYSDKVSSLQSQLQDFQLNYHTLGEVAIELVEALEAIVSGKVLNPDYIQDMCTRLFNVSERLDPSLLAQDFAYIERPRSSLQESVESLRQSISTPIGHELHKRYPQLDFSRLKDDLLQLPNDNKITLLKALRWRLTRSRPGIARDSAINGYVNNDILEFGNTSETSGNFMNFLNHPNDSVKEHFCRLLNSLSSLKYGRDYLQKSTALTHSLCKLLTTLREESPVLRNVLGTVQKLSLRRPLQSSMIKEGLLEWVVDLLSDTEGLSDYTLRYSLALLMNLCLQQEGKIICIHLSPKPLHILSELLEHESNEVRSYVNGILYSLLGVPELRTAALKMDMQDSLQSAMQISAPDLQSQLKYVVTRLEEPFINDNGNGDDTDEESDEQDDPEAVDGEDDDDTLLDIDSTDGEEVLQSYFIEESHDILQSALRMPFTRPITPLSLAQLRMSTIVGTGRPVTTHGEAPLSPIKDQFQRPKTN